MLWLLQLVLCLIRNRTFTFLGQFGAETFCKVTNLMLEIWNAVLVCCNYFVCLPVWVVMSTKSPWTTFTTSMISLCPTLSKLSGIICMFSQMVLLWLAWNRDRITGVCMSTNEKKHLKWPHQLGWRHSISEHIHRVKLSTCFTSSSTLSHFSLHWQKDLLTL